MAAKILLIDDNKSRRNSLRVILMSNAEFAVEAADCSTAISLLGAVSFDLILLDVTLPDKSGFRVLEFLRENHLAGKVIVITGTVELENEIKGTTPGAGDYITKPFNPRYLLMSIEHVLSDKSQTSQRLQIIKAGDFIKRTPAGDLDLKASTKGFAQIADAGSDLHDYTYSSTSGMSHRDCRRPIYSTLRLGFQNTGKPSDERSQCVLVRMRNLNRQGYLKKSPRNGASTSGHSRFLKMQYIGYRTSH